MNTDYKIFLKELNKKNILLLSQKKLLEKQASQLFEKTEKLKQQNAELLNQKLKLEKANKHKSSFLSNMSHELRTPLNSIISLSRLLKRQCNKKMSIDENEYLEVITRNGDLLLSLINDILDLSKIEEGKIELYPKDINLKNLISIITENFEQLADKIGINININFPEDFPIIQSDESRLYRIFQNIIGNGIKFTEKGRVTISGEFDDTNITILVEDTGIGIDEKNISLIFDEFKQIDTTYSSKFEGTGLGLAIALKSTMLISGEIKVTSILGKGTSFKIILPILWKNNKNNKEKSYLPKVKQNETEFKVLTEENNNKPDFKKTIMLIEDDPDNILSLEAILDKKYDLIIASNGEEGIEILNKKNPHLLLLDINLPEMNGIDVLTKIKEIKLCNFPVIAFTALSMRGDREKLLKSGFNDYISKPFIIEELLDKIDKWLRIEDD